MECSEANILSKNILGNHIHYELYQNTSDKPLIVLIHGFLSSTFSYRRLVPLLRANFSVLAVDLPPFGRSGTSRKYYYSYQNMAQTVINLVKSLNYHKFSVVGHSMGGQIAMHTALLEPKMVEKIILLNSSGYMKKVNTTLVYSSYLPFFHLYVKKWLKKTGVLGNLQNVVYDRSIIDEEMIKGYSEPFDDNGIFKGLTYLIRHREGDISSQELKRINTPCLLIWGEQDKVVPLNIGKRLHKDLPNSRLIILPDTGHLVPEEKPELTYQYILDFVSKTQSNRLAETSIKQD